MGYRCGFLLLAEEKNEVTDAIEEVFLDRAKEIKRRSDKRYVEEEGEWGPDSDKSDSQREARESLKNNYPAIKEDKTDSGIAYIYYSNQGYYISEGFDADKWFRKSNGILSMKKNQKYNVLFESCHSGSGFQDIYGGGGGTFTDRHSWPKKKYSYYDQDLFYAIIDKVKGFKKNNVKLFTFDVNNGIRRTKVKFAQDWTGEFL